MQTTDLQGAALSYQQARLWSWQKEYSIYRTLCAVEIRAVLQRDTLTMKVRRSIECHETLRTAFYTLPGMDIPVQVIGDDTLWSCIEINLACLSNDLQDILVHKLFTSLKKRIDDLQYGPLFHIVFVVLAEDRQVLLVSLPALCADSYSLRLFSDEVRGPATEGRLAEDVLQYADVSAWQEQRLIKDEARRESQYWRKIDLSQLSTMRMPFVSSPVPLGRGEEADLNHTGASSAFAPQMVKIPCQEGIAEQIGLLAKQYAVSTSSWLLACWQVLLWRLSDEATFLVGVACDGRNYEELTNALGLYMRFVPVQAHLEQDRRFEQLLVSVNHALQQASKQQLYFIWGRSSNTTQEQTTPGFFPVSFEYDCWPGSLDASNWTLLERWSCSEPFILKLSVLHIGAQLQLELHYDPQYLTVEQVGRLADMLQTLLLSALERPQ